jgi:hypothetical protein
MWRVQAAQAASARASVASVAASSPLADELGSGGASGSPKPPAKLYVAPSTCTTSHDLLAVATVVVFSPGMATLLLSSSVVAPPPISASQCVQFCAHRCLFSPAFLRRKEKFATKKIVAEAEPEPEPEHHIESESTTGLWAAFVLGAALLGTAAYFWSKRRR